MTYAFGRYGTKDSRCKLASQDTATDGMTAKDACCDCNGGVYGNVTSSCHP
jgi:hypothetical protein